MSICPAYFEVFYPVSAPPWCQVAVLEGLISLAMAGERLRRSWEVAKSWGEAVQMVNKL